HGIEADIVAEEESSEGLLTALSEIRGHILLPRAKETRPVLAAGLRDRGGDVDEVILYETVVPRQVDQTALEIVRAGKVDAVTFASSSAVTNLASLLGPDMEALKHNCVVACIGPSTAVTAREHGLDVQVVPEHHTVPGLVEALRAYLAPDAAG